MSDVPGWVPSESERVGRGPTVRQAWGALGCAVGGGFFAGTLVSGLAEERIIAVIIGAPIFLLASGGLLLTMGQRVRVSALLRLALFLVSAGAGFRVAQALDYDITGPPPQDLGLAVSSPEGISALILLALAILLGLYFSFRRFPLKARTATATPSGPTGTAP